MIEWLKVITRVYQRGRGDTRVSDGDVTTGVELRMM